jgi:hyperosmotically inducible periplasmic protein
MKIYLGLFLAALLAVPAWAQAGKVGTGRYDQQIQNDVTKMLSSKDKWKTVTASTDDGIVTLDGSVKVYMDKLDVGRKVNRVSHVNGLRNHIEVSSTMPDAELGQKLADKLRYDRIGQGILFNNLTLKVNDGVATVGGQVLDYPSRDSALAIVETMPGVKDVIDNIDVLPPSPMDDELRIRVARAVYGQPALNRYALDPQKPIRIVVKGGHVSLYGVVDNEADKNIAGIKAKGVPGVFSVENNLVVAGAGKKK